MLWLLVDSCCLGSLSSSISCMFGCLGLIVIGQWLNAYFKRKYSYLLFYDASMRFCLNAASTTTRRGLWFTHLVFRLQYSVSQERSSFSVISLLYWLQKGTLSGDEVGCVCIFDMGGYLLALLYHILYILHIFSPTLFVFITVRYILL